MREDRLAAPCPYCGAPMETFLSSGDVKRFWWCLKCWYLIPAEPEPAKASAYEQRLPAS